MYTVAQNLEEERYEADEPYKPLKWRPFDEYCIKPELEERADDSIKEIDFEMKIL